jgi:hypothetical protein
VQPYCWVKSKPFHLPVVFRLLMFYGVMWPVFLYLLFVYGSIILHIRRVAGKTRGADAEGAKRIRSTINRLACFPLIFVIGISFGSANRVYQFIYQRDPAFWVFKTQVALYMLVSPAHLLRGRAISDLSACGGGESWSVCCVG